LAVLTGAWDQTFRREDRFLPLTVVNVDAGAVWMMPS
jgi:hypothetical protein